MQTLTTRQLEVFNVIYAHFEEHGKPPAIRELCKSLGIASPNGIACHLSALRNKGWVEHAEEIGTSRDVWPVGLRDKICDYVKSQRQPSKRK